MVGLPGAGKSTVVAERYAATHAVVSKDHWPNARRREERQARVVAEALAEGRDVVVDNTNVSADLRAPLLALAAAYGARPVAVFVDTPLPECLARNAGRAGRAQVPVPAILGMYKRLTPPSVTEGFAEVEVVRPAGPEPATPS